MLGIVAQVLLWLVILLGIVIIPFGIPGTFLIVGSALIYAWLTHFAIITWKFLLILLFISILVEVIEFFLGAAAAAKYGASKVGMFGAIIGGFFGAVWGSPLFPLVGTVIGAFVGAFIGAGLFEFIVTRDLEKSLRAGYGAFLGSIGGKLIKITAALAMAVMIGFQLY